jgi:hypothetical protein
VTDAAREIQHGPVTHRQVGGQRQRSQESRLRKPVEKVEPISKLPEQDA